MTFTIRTRGAPGLTVAEYSCPKHGRFEALVSGPPDDMPCPVEEDRSIADVIIIRVCQQPSPWVPSAPKPKVLSVPCSAVSFGGDMKDRPPGMLDTRLLAEGMPAKEWQKVQDKHRQERRHKQMVDRGLKPKRIQVG